MRKPGQKKSGDKVIWLLNENPVVLDFLNKQSNITDALRFVVEYFVEQNGEFDIATVVPGMRDPRNPSRFLTDSRYSGHQSTSPKIQQNVERRANVAMNTSDFAQPAAEFVEQAPLIKPVLKEQEVNKEESSFESPSFIVEESGDGSQIKEVEQKNDNLAKIKHDEMNIEKERTHEMNKGKQEELNKEELPSWLD